KDAVGPRKPLSERQTPPFDRTGHTVQRCAPARDNMFWYSAPLIEPMLQFSSPKRSVKLKAQSKTGSANSNPTGESKPIAIFGFVPIVSNRDNDRGTAPSTTHGRVRLGVGELPALRLTTRNSAMIARYAARAAAAVASVCSIAHDL